LTHFNSLNYSEGMEAQLIALEKKIKQLISLIESAHEKNKGLEARLASSEAHLTKLQSNMKEASLRLEKMMRQLPEDNR
jgi:peptidoglycan hydrolase CwlO-like protein